MAHLNKFKKINFWGLYPQWRIQDFGLCCISALEHGTHMKFMEDDIGPKRWAFIQKNLRSEFANKKKFFVKPPQGKFLLLMVLTMLKFSHNLNQILSKDFKFHENICIRSKVTAFWIIYLFFNFFWKNSKHCNFWTDAYFFMKFEIFR